MATNMKCPLPDCTYSTGEQTEPVAIAYLNAHMYAHMQPLPTQQVATSVVRSSGPKLDRPTVQTGVSMEEWNMFTRRWTIFKEGSHINNDNASHHLFQCADGPLGDALLKTDPDIINKDIDVVLSAMKKLAVIPIATGILRSELLEMKQLRDEIFRKFASRVRGKAETCEYETSATCECGSVTSVNFTDHIMRDVLLAGIYDADIRREMYGIDKILQQPVNDVISLVEKKEMARDAHSVASTSAISSMKQQQKRRVQTGSAHESTQHQAHKSSDSDKNKQGNCPHCKKTFALHREGQFGWNSKPFDMCRDCFRTRRRQRSQNGASVATVSETDANADIGVIVAQISSIDEVATPVSANEPQPDVYTPVAVPKKKKAPRYKRKQPNINSSSASLQNVRMDHHIFSKGEWKRAKFLNHPTWPTCLSVNKQDYAEFSRSHPKVPSINVNAKLDTCA